MSFCESRREICENNLSALHIDREDTFKFFLAYLFLFSLYVIQMFVRNKLPALRAGRASCSTWSSSVASLDTASVGEAEEFRVLSKDVRRVGRVEC